MFNDNSDVEFQIFFLSSFMLNNIKQNSKEIIFH